MLRNERIPRLQVDVDAYFVIRNAREHGASNVLRVMNKYPEDLRVQGVGLQCMASSLIEGISKNGCKNAPSPPRSLLLARPKSPWHHSFIVVRYSVGLGTGHEFYLAQPVELRPLLWYFNDFDVWMAAGE